MNDEKLWEVFSQFIRLRDSNREGICSCFTCSRLVPWKQAECGHGIKRQHMGTKYHEKNNHAQCHFCNGTGDGMVDTYKRKMDERYGPGTWEKMEIKSRQVFKFGQSEIDALTRHYKNLVTLLKVQKQLAA